MAGLYDERVLGAQQRAEFARKLRESSNQPAGQMVSGWYVPNTGGAVVDALRNVLGAYQEREATDELKGLQREKLQSTIQAMNQAGIQAPESMLKEAGTPEIKPGMWDRLTATLRGEEAKGTPAQPYQQNVAQNVPQAQRNAGLSNLIAINPEYAQNVLALEKLQADQSKALEAEKWKGVPSGAMPGKTPGSFTWMTDEKGVPYNQTLENRALAGQKYLSPQELQTMQIQQANLGIAQSREAREAKKESEPKPLTESQANANLFGKRMMESNKILSNITDYSPTAVSAALATENTPLIGMGVNAMLGQNEQQIAQAQRDFLNAALRKESGASISATELANGRRQYFPQPGDKPDVLAQKAKNRETAIQGIFEGIPERQRPNFEQNIQHPQVTETKIIGGKTYHKINGEWHEGN